jgi:acyl-CoA synthetase (AMP-forming)/AMP-acid ligase II
MRMVRTELYADPKGRFVHDVIFDSCARFPDKIALVDSSCDVSSGSRRLSYGKYGEIVERLARGFVAAGLRPGEVIAIYLPNCWEFCAAYHAATLAGGVPTLLNPSYREREVRYQLENSGAAFLITDGSLLEEVHLSGIAGLRRIYTTRHTAGGAEPFADLLNPLTASLSVPQEPSEKTLGALPYSSGTTGLPKGVMLSHFNLVANVFQFIGPRGSAFTADDVVLCFLPLYHIYGLNVILNPLLALGGTIVLMPRFNVTQALFLMVEEGVTMMPAVPPALNALCQAVEAGQFPRDHRLRWVKSGAAPLAPELGRRFVELTGVLLCQGYGMTEASPVTHIGFLEPELYRFDTIGQPLAQTDCRVVSTDEFGENESGVACGQPGELVMRGPQFMMGYWKDPQATAAVLRDGWFWSGDIVTCDSEDFYRVVDRRKEMIKYKGFPVAPAEIEALLLEHPAVRDCGVVGRADAAAGEIPVAFIVLREGSTASTKLGEDLCGFVAERLTSYKQPRQVHFVDAVPRTLSGKILRKELRKTLAP